jgi:predicted NUDIX family phosphoesterase
MTSYLQIAEKILSTANEPLSAREILERASQLGILPPNFTGRTPHKTMHARLAVDIRTFGEQSRFYRHLPGRFALRHRVLDLSFDGRYKDEFLAAPRRKELSYGLVLMVPEQHIIETEPNALSPDLEWLIDLFRSGHYFYMERGEAEECTAARQIVTYLAILQSNKVLTYARGRFVTSGIEFIGKRSIGFGGHVEYDDINMFDPLRVGLVDNVKRELHEELRIDPAFLERAVDQQLLKLIGILNDNTTQNGRKHLAVAFCLELPRIYDVTKRELSINNLAWVSFKNASRHILEYEAWSQYFIRYLVDGHQNI